MDIKQNNKWKNNRIQRIVLFILVFSIGYLLLVTAITPKQYSFKRRRYTKSRYKSSKRYSG